MPGGYETDTVTRLETNLDDCSPELLGAVMEKLLAAGALDVWFTPIQMKKHRPGVMLSVLCDRTAAAGDGGHHLSRRRPRLACGRRTCVRLKLARRFEKVATEFGEVTVKLGLKGDVVVQVAPEFESCRALAERSGQPLRAIYEAALRAWHARST